MIETAISYGFSEENRYKIKDIPQSIQLSIWKYDIWKENMDKIIEKIYLNSVSVKTVHLPLDTLKRPFKDIFDLMGILHSTILCNKFIIHPNKGILEFIEEFVNWSETVTLCIENFQYRKKKTLRNPIEIITKCVETGSDKIKMCFDTSHVEAIWFDGSIMTSLLKHIKVIHLSNRIGKQSHLPFNIQNGDLNLVGFVHELKKRYKWEGLIVLEYLQDYQYKLNKNLEYLKRLVE